MMKNNRNNYEINLVGSMPDGPIYIVSLPNGFSKRKIKIRVKMNVHKEVERVVFNSSRRDAGEAIKKRIMEILKEEGIIDNL